MPAKDGLPEYCRVLGYVRPAINFELRLPVADWNGKFYMAGCGGFCGTLDTDRPGHVNAANHGLRRGYAAITTDAGHWLILWHGWADAVVTPLRTVAYYEAMEKAMGGAVAVRDFARLFMIPGMDHCGIANNGPGVDQRGFDPLAALEAWVEKGEAPESIVSTKLGQDGKSVWSRPVCAYPSRAVFSGTGERADAKNWTCRTQ